MEDIGCDSSFQILFGRNSSNLFTGFRVSVRRDQLHLLSQCVYCLALEGTLFKVEMSINVNLGNKFFLMLIGKSSQGDNFLKTESKLN